MRPEQTEQEVARLYDSFGPSLYRYALMILADREAAEDVIQQVFVALLRRGRALQYEERYLRQAVRNACYTSLRRRRVRLGAGVIASGDVLLESVASADAPSVTPEERMALEGAVRQLTPEQREVLHLHVYDGLTFREVADATGESQNTIASRYRYALEKLRLILGAR